MKNSRIAAQLRSLALAPSLESADAESTTETGPGSDQVVKTDVDTSAESPNQTTEETTPAEGKDLSVTTSEVGERSDLESAQTQIKAGEGAPTEASLESDAAAAAEQVADNSKNVDASAVTGPDGDGVVKQTLDEGAASPNQTTEETTPAENKDLTAKTVEVGERGELESAETTSEADGENVVVSTESLTLAAIGLVGLGAAFSTWAASKFQSEVKQIEALQKQIKTTKEEINKSEREFIDRAKAVAAKAKPAVSQESVGDKARAVVSGVASTGLMAGTGFMVGGPMGAAIGALLAAGAWTGDWKQAALVNKTKRAQLQKLELQLADRQLELATRVAAAEKQYKVSNEGLDEFEAMTVSVESFKTVIGLIFSQEKRLEWSLAQAPKWHAEVAEDIKDCRERIAAAKKADNPAKVRNLEEELAWLIECKEEGEATDKVFAEKLAKIKAKKAAAQKVVSTEAFDDAAAAAAAAFAEGAAGAAEAAAAATGGDAGEVTEAVAEVAETVAENVATEVAEDAGAEAGAEAAAEGDVEDVSDDELAAGEAELTELDGSIEEAEGHAEEYEQAAATMESLIDALQSAQRSGGLTPQSAQFATIAFESVGVRLTGAPFQNAHGESAMPSLESFGGTMRRDEATTISLENATTWYAKIWEVLKNTWQQIKAWIVNFIKVLFSQAERYKQRAQKIQQLANGNLAQPKNRTVSAGAAGAKIAVGDKLDVNNMSLLLNFATAVKASVTDADQVEANVAEFINSLDQAKVDAYKAGSASESAAAAKGPFKNPIDVDGKPGFATDVLPGNYRLAVVQSDANAVIAKIAAAMGRNAAGSQIIKRVAEEGGAGEDATMNLWLGPQIGSVCTHVIKTLDVVAALRQGWEKAASIKITQQGGEFSEEDQKVVKEIVSAAQRESREQAAAIKAVGQALVATSGHFLDVCAVHLKEYGVNVGVADKAVAGVKDAAAKAGDAAGKAADAVGSAAKSVAKDVKETAGVGAAMANTMLNGKKPA